MVRSIAGKARVSVVWMVTVGVLFLIALFLAFVTQGHVKEKDTEVANAKTELEAAKASVRQLEDARTNLSRVLGWYNRETNDYQSSPEAAKAALEELKNTFPDLGVSEPDVETSLPKILAAFNVKTSKIAELETRIKGLESEVGAAQSATSTVTAEKDSTIAGLRQQIADETKNAEGRVAELESSLEQTRTQLSERDGELRKTRDDSVSERRKHEGQKAIDDARINQLALDTTFARDPHWTKPDGSILEVSDRLGTGWIDIGANQRVVRGIVFEVRSGRPGDNAVKALAEVTSVKGGSAEVLFSAIADRFSPPVAGDVISNRLFDPAGGRNAVLVGRFSGGYNNADLKILLEKMGIHVQPKVDKTTHFLIVGSELWNDPSTGEPLAEPMQVSDLAEYKQAESLGVQVIPLQDLREFFRLGVGQ